MSKHLTNLIESYSTDITKASHSIIPINYTPLEIDKLLETLRSDVLSTSSRVNDSRIKINNLSARCNKFFNDYSYAKIIYIELNPNSKDYRDVNENLEEKLCDTNKNYETFEIIIEIRRKQLEFRILTLNYNTHAKQLVALLKSFESLIGNNRNIGLNNFEAVTQNLSNHEKAMSTINSGTTNILTFIQEVRDHILSSNHVLVQMTNKAKNNGISVGVGSNSSSSNLSTGSQSNLTNNSQSSSSSSKDVQKSNIQQHSSALSQSISSISSNSVAESLSSNEDAGVGLTSNNNKQDKTEADITKTKNNNKPSKNMDINNPNYIITLLDADSRQLNDITERIEFMYFKLMHRVDDRKKLLYNGESFYKLGKLVTDILHDLEDKYNQSIGVRFVI